MLNLTPHPVRLFDGDRVICELPVSGPPVRVQTPPQPPKGTVYLWNVDVPVVALQSFAGCQVSGLPGPSPDGSYPPILVGIVGIEAVLEAYPGPVYCTDTGPASVVRDRDGSIIGVRRLQVARP